MGTVRRRVTYADLAGWPDDGRRYELYDGEALVVPDPLPRHQLTVIRLIGVLRDYARRHGGEVLDAPLDIVLSDVNVVQPDIVFFRESRRHLIRQDVPIRTVPDMAVEVLSASTEGTDRGRKMRLLERHGLPEYWLVDPHDETIEIWRLEHGRYDLKQRASGSQVARSATLPELRFRTSRAFVSNVPAARRRSVPR